MGDAPAAVLVFSFVLFRLLGFGGALTVLDAFLLLAGGGLAR